MKKGLIFICVFACLMFAIVLGDTISTIAVFTNSSDYTLRDPLIPENYIYSNEHYDTEGFRDYTDFAQYIYSASGVAAFQEHPAYRLVTEEDVPELLEFFDNFDGWIEWREGYHEWYSFNAAEQVTPGDYFILNINNPDNSVYGKFHDYDIYYYDVQTHMLCFFHNNS